MGAKTVDERHNAVLLCLLGSETAARTTIAPRRIALLFSDFAKGAIGNHSPAANA